MPSMTSGLPRSVMRWVSQVSVSVGATLVATMIYGALPKVAVPQLEPAPELTSGGKFAARALAPEPLQVDGLGTMPMPRLAMEAAVLPAAFSTGSTPATVEAPGTAGSTAASLPAVALPVLVPLHRLPGSGGPTRGVSVEAPVRTARALHPLARADAKHAARMAVTEAAAQESTAQAVSDEPIAATGDGLLPKVMSSARGAWSVTASAGDALLAHVIPQMP